MSSSSEQENGYFDVAIVGAGPAGSSAAYHLSGAGMSVIVAERLNGVQYGRYHSICGGGVSMKTFPKRFPIREDEILNRVHDTVLVWPDGRKARIGTEGYIIDRPAMLSRLRHESEEKGAEFVKDSITDIFRDGDGFVLKGRGTIRCRYLIGADGAFSIVRKKVFGTEPKGSLPATEFIREGDPPDEMIFRTGVNHGEGYSWEFPHGNGVCTGSVDSPFTDATYSMKGTRFIPYGGVVAIVDGNALLLGDAAGMANPVSFGGLRAAFLSAEKAAHAIIEDDLDGYQRWWDESVMSDRRFMEFRDRVSAMDDETLNRISAPFGHGNVYLDGFLACLRHPRSIPMYFTCLFAFMRGW